VDDHHQRNGAEAEEIHLPGPSLVPLFTAAGITLALLGLILTWWFVVAGGVIALLAVWRWIRDVRDEIESLPAERH
jgi:Cytochrome c oxidase subunit IV